MTERQHCETRVLILAPTPKDATLTRGMFERAGLPCVCCSDMDQLGLELKVGAGAVLIAEEALAGNQYNHLAKGLSDQPPWSDLPVLIVARAGADSPAVGQVMYLLGNVTVLERPVRVASLVSAVRTALRARRRQYQLRDHLAERERSIQDQAFLAAIVTSSDDAIYSKSLDGAIRTWNAAAERLFGYSAEEAIGSPITLLIPPEKQDEEISLLDRLRQGGHIQHFETIRLTRDGKRLDVLLTLSPIWAADDKIIGASTIARDITQRKQAEEALRQADRRKDEFLAILAHELRNPLAPIRNSLHILRMNSPHDSATERVGEMMERQVNHMVRLVDDLLEVSRITRGKIELRMEPIELAAVVRSAVETSAPLIDASGHQLALSIPPEPLTLNGDSVRLTQVLANLLNNSAKYTPPGGQIWLTIRQEEQEAVISVRDTGAGIPAEMLPHIFKLFTQVDRQEDRAQGGLGIGLTLVKSLVEMHGGQVMAHSDGPGKGSEFVIRMPLAAALRPVHTILPEGKPAVLAARRVLVVDDNRDSAESMGMLLKMLGAEVQVAYGALEALEAVATHKPAAILLDIGLPEMDGYEVARRIRRDPQYQDVTLIALTGWGQDEDRLRSQTAGFNYHLVKPADLDALTALLTSLEQRPTSRGVVC